MDAWFERVNEVFYDNIGLGELATEELRYRIWNCDETGFCFCTSATVKKITRG